MSEGLSESAIVRAVADQAAQRITRRVIADLQRITDTLSGDDSELKTAWDEICAQVQHDQSIYWDEYDDTVQMIAGGYISQLPKHEREVMWLQTDAGIGWECKDPEDRESYPVCDEHIVNWLAHEYLYPAAGSWSNARIRAYIERASQRD
jgi:hypothetical protein